MITQEEFDIASKLSYLHIDPDQHQIFFDKMNQVVQMIDELRTIDIDQMRNDLGIVWSDQNISSDRVLQQLQSHTMDRDIFFDNITHTCINDSIMIKSSLVNTIE
jgi:Asp-tRNA(Asn)/Glu-tRNA(Gln) amidotransferase C subunit